MLYCDDYFVLKPILESHQKIVGIVGNIAGNIVDNIAGIVYEFKNNKIFSFQGNFK